MHVHIGLVFALTSFFSVITIGFFWRLGSIYFKDTPIGQGMAFLY